MNKKHLSTVLCFFVLFSGAAFSMSGCGSSGAETKSAASTASSAPSAVSSGNSAQDSITVDSSVADSLPNYLRDSAPAESAAAASGYGEGTNVVPGSAISVSENAAKHSTGEVCTINSEKGSYELTIDSIALTNERNSTLAADKVIKITYTYKNTNFNSTLLIGNLDFKLMNSDGLACAQYTLDSAGSKDSPEAMPAEKGNSCTATIAYAVSGSSNKVTLIFDDLTGGSNTELTFDAEV